MKIKKMFVSIITITITVLLIIIVVTNSRYLWKIFGYICCEDPSQIKIHNIMNNNFVKTVQITGTIQNSEKKYSGYKYRIEDDTIYLGLKYNMFWGYDKDTTDFSISIPYKDNIRKIYIVNGIDELKVWPKY